VPNNITPYDNFWYANRALERLEKNLMFAKTVYRGYDEEAGRREGQVIKIRKPGGFTAVQYPAQTVQDLNPFEQDLRLDQFWHVTFQVSDQEKAYSGERIIGEHIAPAMQALAERIETSLSDLILYAGNRTIATAPAAIADLTALRSALNQRSVPKGDRFLAVPAAIEEQLLNVSTFTSATDNAQGGQAQLEGILGRKYGFDIYHQEILPALVASTIAGATIVAAAAAKGATTLAISGATLTGIARRGFTFTLAGHTQVYTVTADATAAANAISVNIWPPLQVAITGGTNVTLGALTGYPTVGCAYHRNAFGMAMAMLDTAGNNRGAEQAFVRDPRTNLAIRVTRWYDPGATGGPAELVRFDALWGVTALDPNMAQGYLD
jgi:hypothetical protein